MEKFSEFKNINELNKNSEKKENGIREKDIADLYDLYSTYSQDDLMKEFINLSQKKKDDGSLNPQFIDNVKGVLGKNLNEEQNKKLNDLINLVK